MQAKQILEALLKGERVVSSVSGRKVLYRTVGDMLVVDGDYTNLYLNEGNDCLKYIESFMVYDKKRLEAEENGIEFPF